MGNIKHFGCQLYPVRSYDYELYRKEVIYYHKQAFSENFLLTLTQCKIIVDVIQKNLKRGKLTNKTQFLLHKNLYFFAF